MIDSNIIEYVWSTIQSGVLGNAAYDGLKKVLGVTFGRLNQYAKEHKKDVFESALLAAIENNKVLLEEINNLRHGHAKAFQSHFGSGDNIGRDKIINNIHSREKQRNLKLHIIHGDEIIIDTPGARQIPGPSYLLSASNTGEETVLAKKLGVVFSDSQVGSVAIEKTIPIGVTANWQIQKSAKVMIETNYLINGMRVASQRTLNEDQIVKFFIEDHTGTRFWLDFSNNSLS